MPYSDTDKQKRSQTTWYQNNKERYVQSNRNSRARKIEKLRELKRKPCLDCEIEYHPDIMHFHHLDPTQKEFSIGACLHKWGWNRILAETKKCVLLCANCHGLRHVALRQCD